MTGARPARLLAATLLAAPLLLAATDAAAQTRNNARFVLSTSAPEIMEGGSVTVGIACDDSLGGGCSSGSTLTTGTGTPTITISISSTATNHGATLNGNLFTYTEGGAWNQTPAGTVTISVADDGDMNGHRTLTISGAASGYWDGTNNNRIYDDDVSPPDITLQIIDDESLPRVSLSLSPATIDESGMNNRATVTASVPSGDEPGSDLTVTVSAAPVSPAVAGDYSLSGSTLTIAAGATTSTGTVTITAMDNSVDAADKTVTVTGTPSLPLRYRSGTATLTIADDDAVTVTLSTSAAGGRLAEGESATVTARLDRSIGTATTITVSAAAGTGATAADFRLSANKTLTVAAGSRSSTGVVTITAADDDVDGPETRQVTVSGSASGGRGAADPDSLTLTITDDDAAPRVSLALAPAMIDESGPANAARVTAALSHPSSMATTVAVSAGAGVTVGADNVLTIPAGAAASADAVTLTAVDDEEQEPDREVAVSGRAENAHGIEQPAAVVLTIRDDDGTEAVTAVLLPEAARAMADSRASAVRRRLERADAAGAPEMASLPGLPAERGLSLQQDERDWKAALAGSSFALPLNAAGGGSGGGGITAWGSGDYANLDGEARGVSWDGDVVSAHLGLDRRLANGMRVGLAGSWSEAKFDYMHEGREGEWELEMASAQPYLGWTTPGGLELWTSAGAGSGELEIASGGTPREKSDADMWLAAAGARKPLHETGSGLQVSLRGEALYSSFEVDGNGGRIQAYTADASRLRLALEARRERTLASGARLSPRFELGLRHDGGDGETGAGVELGGGAEYVSGRLSASGGARALAANSDYDEWGADLALAYAPGVDGRGFSFRLAPSWGAAQSGTRALWENGAAGLSGTAEESDPGGRLEAELGYGLKSPWSRDLLTLALGVEAGGDVGVACRLKGAVALNATASLSLELEARDPPSGGAERSLMATGELRF